LEKSQDSLKKMEKFTKFGSLIEKYSAFLFDCDGVLWKGGNVIPHSMELLKHLVASGK
jgi:ribonucleotide monophosphatase NagD (HAD superfamily)